MPCCTLGSSSCDLFLYLEHASARQVLVVAQAEANGGELEVDPTDLTASERAAFERAVAAGALRSATEPWHPWWLACNAARLALAADGTALVRETAGALAAGLGCEGHHVCACNCFASQARACTA